MPNYNPAIIVISLLLPLSIKAQIANPATINLLILNESNKQPVESISKWHSMKTQKDFYFKSDNKGKATVLIPKDDSYEVTIAKSLDSYNVDIPNTVNFSKDLILQFELEQPISNQKPIVQVTDRIDSQNLVGLQIFNKPKSKIVEIVDLSTNEIIKTHTNDTISLLLYSKKQYKVQVDGVNIENNVIKFATFSPKLIPFVLFFSSNKTAQLIYVSDKAAVNLIRTNTKNQIVPNDSITLIGQKTKKQYAQLTGQNGAALFLVPQGEIYDIKLKYYPSIPSISVTNSVKKDFTTFSYTIDHPSTAEIEEMKKEEIVSQAEKDAAIEVFNKRWKISPPQFHSKVSNEKDTVLNRMKRYPNYFSKFRNSVCEVFSRNINTWKNKGIVLGNLDDKLIEEVALWHILDLNKGEKKSYLFSTVPLNASRIIDGDYKPIQIPSFNHIDSVVMRFKSYSTDNCVQALIRMQDSGDSNAELILVSNYFSKVYGLELVTNIKKPVRIVLGSVNILHGIHPDYLWLAYKTGGSIHTIEDDVWNISSTPQGGIITIGGHSYKLLHNRFFEVK
jgi:hypothetical protein